MSTTLTEVPSVEDVLAAEASFVNRWLEEVGRTDPIFPIGRSNCQTSSYRNSWRSGTTVHRDLMLEVDSDGRLIVVTGEDSVVLAQAAGRRKDANFSVLLNGDGFATNIMTMLQTRVRQRCQKKLGIRRSLIVPFAALEGASLRPESIRAINVSGDVNENLRLVMTKNGPPVPMAATVGTWTAAKSNRTRTSWDEFDVWTEIINGRRWRLRSTISGSTARFEAETAIPGGTSSWRPVAFEGSVGYVTYTRHRLGASIFSAIGPDDRRHRYISAFDEQDREMYYLAQLPDHGLANNYREAINLLAPPAVHRALADGKLVCRQGDIFAIETNITNADIEKRGGVIVNRADVITTGTMTIKPRSSKVKRSGLMIHDTGHTATHVAKLPNGITFIRGVMCHDPFLEERGRSREHRNVKLGASASTWFLACRNTVPMAPVINREEEDAKSAQAA